MEAIEETLAVVRPRLSEYAERLGIAPHQLRELPAERFLYSILVPFDCGELGPPVGVVVKIHIGDQRVAAAAAEFANLRALHRHFGADGECRVPQPLDHFPDHGAVVMERVFGNRLDRRIRTEASRFATRGLDWSLEQCRRAGAWLMRLGAQGDAGVERRSRGAWLGEVERMLREARAAGLSARAAAALEHRLGQLTPDERVRPLPGDFSPYNALANEQAIYFVDFAEMPPAQIDECKAFFWSGLELSKLHPLLSPAAVTRCQQAFDDGGGASLTANWRAWGLLRQLSYFPARRERRPWRQRVWNRWRVAWVETRLQRLVA